MVPGEGGGGLIQLVKYTNIIQDEENVVEDYPADQTEYEDHETRVCNLKCI